MTGYSGGAGAAAYASMVNAVRAMGPIVEVTQEDFHQIISKQDQPLVLVKNPSFWSKKYKYLTSYKGFFFLVTSTEQMILPGKSEIITVDKLWLPQG